MTAKSLTSPLNLGGVALSSGVLLAPLAGVSDVGFRAACRACGAALAFTEMISAKGLVRGNKKTKLLLAAPANETPAAVQLFGSEPAVMAEACRSAELAEFDLIDLNMGCPVEKIVKSGEGAALMQDAKLAERIISACVKAAGRPVSVKLRKGFYEGDDTAAEFARMCEGAGAAFVTVHGRVRERMFGGENDKKCIAGVVSAVKIPVIANGGVYSPEDAESLFRETGAAGVMVARGALGRPQIFAEITGRTALSAREAALLHAETLRRFSGERFTVLNMRKHLLWYLSRMPGGKKHKTAASALTGYTALLAFIDETFCGV